MCTLENCESLLLSYLLATTASGEAMAVKDEDQQMVSQASENCFDSSHPFEAKGFEGCTDLWWYLPVV